MNQYSNFQLWIWTLQAIVCVYLASPTNEKSFLIAKAFSMYHFTLKEFKPASALIC